MNAPTGSIPPLLAAGGEHRTAGRGSRADAGREFASVLGRHGVGPLARAGATGSASEARRAAEEFVALALVQPVLAQARESSMAAEPFAPSPAERQFGALHDAIVAQRITQSAQFPLVDRIAESLMGRGAAGGRSR